MDSQVSNRRPKIWLIVVIALVVVGCCCLSLVFAGVLFTRSRNMSLVDLVSRYVQGDPQMDVTGVIPQAADDELSPQEQPVQEESVPSMPMDDYLLAITSSGIWKVNEQTQGVSQISDDVLDAPTPYRKGLSPDKKFFAYTTGDINPTLVVLNLQTNSRVFETPLSGPNSQIMPDMNAGDPGQSVLLAMQTSGSMAWSPDSAHLAFVAAMDNSNTDLYLLNAADLSIDRLSDESSNAAYINWSPDGRFIEFVTVDNFGTGAGMGMDALWVYDRSQVSLKLLEQITSSGEEFLSWIDNESFYISSWSTMCSKYNLRAINAVTGNQDVILESCFSGAAYDPEGEIGLVAVSDMLVGDCQCGEVNEFGTFIFGKILGMDDIGVKIKKFEQINAYGLELLDPGNLFAVYTEEGLTHLFDTTGFPISIPYTVSGLKPFTSPTGDYWAWYPYYGDKTGLLLTDNFMNLYELSASSSGNVVWSNDGDGLYFIELNRIFYADAPDFIPALFAEIPVSEIYAIGK